MRETVLGGLHTWIEGPESEDPEPWMVLLHGRGADGRDLVGLGPHFGFEGLVLAPDAPLPWEDGAPEGRAWYHATSDRPQLDSAVEQVLAFLDAAAAELPVTGRPILGGFSQGGLLTYEVGLRHPERFRALVVIAAFMAAGHPLRRGEVDHLNLPPLLVAHGSQDPVVPLDLAREAHEILQTARVPHLFLVEEVPHTIGPGTVAAVADLLARLDGRTEP